MRREIEPFKRSLAQGRKYPLTEPANKYRMNREDRELLRPVSEQLGRFQSSNREGATETEGATSRGRPDDDDEDLLRPVDQYLEKQSLEEFMRAQEQKGTPDFLQPIDDYLQKQDNKDQVYKSARELSGRRFGKSSDEGFLDYSSLVQHHQRQQEKEQLQAELAALRAPLYKRRKEPVEKAPSFMELRLRHDNAIKKPKTSRLWQRDNGKVMEVEDDDDLLLPCTLDLLKYGQNDDERLKRRCDLETLRVVEGSRSPSPPPPQPPLRSYDASYDSDVFDDYCHY